MLSPKAYSEALMSKFDKEVCISMLDDILTFYEQLWIYPKGFRHPLTNERKRAKRFERSSIYMYISATKSYII